MDYMNFTKEMKALLERELPELQFSVQTVEKLQGQPHVAISVGEESKDAYACINLEPFYERVQQGESLFAVMEELVVTADRIAASLPEKIPFPMDYAWLRERLVMQVVSTERNRAFLQTLPHRDIVDMSVVYRFHVEDDGEVIKSVLITNALLEELHITAAQLMQDAEEFAPKHLPMWIRKMVELLEENTGIRYPGDNPICIASNTSNIYGAGILAYPEFMKRAADYVHGDFYLLPSSIHEVMMLPDDGTVNATVLTRMVQSVNETDVLEEEILTDTVYHYECRTGCFEKALDYEARMRNRKRAQ